MKKIKVVVVFGGKSSEKEVSSWTAKSFIEALKRLSLKYSLIDLNDKRWLEKVKQINPSVAILAVHGAFGEDGQLQKILENNHINYTGSNSSSSALAWDKLRAQECVSNEGIAVPQTIVINKKKHLSKLPFDFPVIVKPNMEGSSFGITIVENHEKLKTAIALAMKYDSKVLVQEYIKGREITCGVIDVYGKVRSLPIVEIRPKTHFFDFKAKYDANFCEEIVPAPISREITRQIQEISVKIFQLFKCRDYVRIDFIIKDDQPYFLEVNTLPGCTKTSLLPKALAAAGIEFDKFIKQLLNNRSHTSKVWE